jgi:hypothetical protein
VPRAFVLLVVVVLLGAASVPGAFVLLVVVVLLGAASVPGAFVLLVVVVLLGAASVPGVFDVVSLRPSQTSCREPFPLTSERNGRGILADAPVDFQLDFEPSLPFPYVICILLPGTRGGSLLPGRKIFTCDISGFDLLNTEDVSVTAVTDQGDSHPLSLFSSGSLSSGVSCPT